MIIKALKQIHKELRLHSGTVSDHTKSAQAITKQWQKVVCVGNIESEVSVSPENNEKIDVVDKNTGIAYELKVSGKNTHHEFYKDLVKTITYNEYQEETNRLAKLVFISEETGIKALKSRLDSKFLQCIEKHHLIEIELISI